MLVHAFNWGPWPRISQNSERYAGVLCRGMAVYPLTHALLFLAARNVVANSDYCPQCLSAGGPGVVGSGASFPNGKNGVCGDPYTSPSPRNHEANGKYWTGVSQATYTEGQIIELDVVLTAYHKGDFDFRICKIQGTSAEDEASQLTEGCLNLNVLKQADVPGVQSPGSSRYFIGPSSNDWEYRMQYQLPEGLTCDGKTSRCVMQWHYLTGNSCNPPNTPSKYGSSGLAECGSTSPYPEVCILNSLQ